MTFADIPAGAAVFLDANTLVYHFTSEPKYGAACTQLVKQVELKQLHGFSSTHVVGDVCHRVMTLEAINLLGWPPAGIAARLRKHHAEIAKLSVYGQAVARIPNLNIQVLPVTQTFIEAATSLCRQFELLTGDGLVVAVMQANGLTRLASNDADFDRVTGISRYSPV
jgi:predicted nucleic acid-binding protein